jgi:hypothetical protein
MADPGVGDIHAEPGSREWAIAVRLQLESKANSMGTGVNDVAMRLERLFTTGAWTHLFKEDGSTFASIEEYIAYAKPYGMGVPVGVMVRYLSMVREGRTVCAHLSKVAPADSVPCVLPTPGGESVEAHPAANLFPMLSEDARRALADDIAVNGQREPIVLWEGQILDGRNRLAACDLAGVVPVFKALAHCPDPVAYVLSANLHRRHLTDDDRAFCAARMKGHYMEKAKANHVEASKTGGKKAGRGRAIGVKSPDLTPIGGGYWYDLAAADWHTSASAVQRADAILSQSDALPELVDAVKAGTVTLSGGATIAKATKAGAVTVEEARAAVTTKETAKALRDQLAADKPKPTGKGGGGKSKGAPAPAAPATTAPAEEKPAPPARHPVLVEIDAAKNLRALDAAFNRVALANLSAAESAEASAAYQRRSTELRAQVSATTETPATVSPQATTAQPVQATARQLPLAGEDTDEIPAGRQVNPTNANALHLVGTLSATIAKYDEEGSPVPVEFIKALAELSRQWGTR